MKKDAGEKLTPRNPRSFPRRRRASSGALQVVAALLGDTPRQRTELLGALRRLTEARVSLNDETIAALAQLFNCSIVEIYELVTFYPRFRDAQANGARPVIRVCEGLVCAQAGAAEHKQTLSNVFSDVKVVASPCLGACDTAPAIHFPEYPLGGVEAGVYPRRKPPARPVSAHGFTALQNIASGALSRDGIISELQSAGLRGCGGAGYPTATKWRQAATQSGRRIVIVNAEESELGAFKDRHCIESTPARVVEGALVAAWVTGADQVIVYLRDEYEALADRLLAAADAAYASAPIPKVPLTIRFGGGAYVCGEETALIESLEGRRGVPRFKPPHPVESGFLGRPTLVNNVETFYWVSRILEHGSLWYNSQGRHGRRGVRLFAVSGRVTRPGVYEAPIGISLQELIAEYAGGMARGHHLSAFLPAGSAGGIVTASHADVPLDVGTLEPFGASLGSASIIVLSQADDLRHVARNVIGFLADESCGHCTPCRVGTTAAREILANEQIEHERLDDLSNVMRESSHCGLGRSAGVFLSTWLANYKDVT